MEMFTLSDMMFVNADTLASLQVIQSESHPNSHMQGPNKSTSGAKESLSVYGLFRCLAHTPQGKHRLKQIFLRPSIDLSVIEERHSTIRVLLRPENEPSLIKMVQSLKEVSNIRAVVKRLQKGSGESGKSNGRQGGVWSSILKFSYHVLKILEAVQELAGNQDLALCRKVSNNLHLCSVYADQCI